MTKGIYMYIKKYFLIKYIAILLFVFLAGCSSIEVSHDYNQQINFTQIKHYQWSPTESNSSLAKFERKNPFIAKRIRRAIKENLIQKGFSMTEKNTDAFITYQMKKKKNVMKKTNTRVGVGLGSVFNHGFGSVGFDLSPEIETFDEGHLRIDILDKNNQLLWRGKSTSPIQEHPTPEETTKLINEIIKKLLENYPPK